MLNKMRNFVDDRPWIYLVLAGVFLTEAIDAYRQFDLAKQAAEAAEQIIRDA